MSQLLKPASDAELSRLRETQTHIIIKGGNGNNAKTLHLCDPDSTTEPLCGGSNGQQANWRVKPYSCFPRRYKPVCKSCLTVWRE